jgi:hypothetical protein
MVKSLPEILVRIKKVEAVVMTSRRSRRIYRTWT